MVHFFKLICSSDSDETLSIYIENSDYVDGIVSNLTLKFENSSNVFINSILNLPLFFNSIYKTEVDLLLWINFQNNNQNNQNNQNNIIIDKKFSWLTKMFIKKIGKCL